MYLRALAEYEKARRSEHISKDDTISNLGLFYSNQSKRKQLRILAGKKKAWGAERKQPLDIRYNIALLYHVKHQ